MREIFGKGLFIRKDKDGNDCCIGDRVEITRPEFTIKNDNYGDNDDDFFVSSSRTIEESIFEGTLILLKSKGVMIKTEDGYRKVPTTDNSRVKRIWKKL